MTTNPSAPGEATPLVCKHGHLARSCEICDLERQLARAQARVAELEKDAARYRWWRKGYCGDCDELDRTVNALKGPLDTPEQLDAAIDAAISAGKDK